MKYAIEIKNLKKNYPDFGLKVDEYDKRELKNLNKKTDFYELKRTCYGLKRVKVN